MVRLNEFLPDTQEIGSGVIVGQGNWEATLESNKQAFGDEFVQRARFTSAFPASMPAEDFVDRLFQNAGVTPSATERSNVIGQFGSGDA